MIQTTVPHACVPNWHNLWAKESSGRGYPRAVPKFKIASMIPKRCLKDYHSPMTAWSIHLQLWQLHEHLKRSKPKAQFFLFKIDLGGEDRSSCFWVSWRMGAALSIPFAGNATISTGQDLVLLRSRRERSRQAASVKTWTSPIPPSCPAPTLGSACMHHALEVDGSCNKTSSASIRRSVVIFEMLSYSKYCFLTLKRR